MNNHKVAPHGYSQSDAEFNRDLTRQRIEAERSALPEQPKSIQGKGEPIEIGAQHSPLPLATEVAGHVSLFGQSHTTFAIVDANRVEIARMTTLAKPDDAKLIVRAVNNAERLAEAVRDCLINNPKHFTPAMNGALSAWEAAQ